MVGKKHSVEARRRISESLKKQYQDGLRVNHTVLSVEECGRQDVYDVIVPGAANFVANGVVVHNSGKSSLAEALKWGLYGETTRQAVDKSLTVDHVIRKGAGAAEVMVMFEVNHEAWSVTRSRSAKTHTLEVTQTSPAGGTQTWTGVPAQEQLARVLGVDAVQFSNFVYLDGSYPLLFAPSNDRTRKDILADLVDVAIVQQAQDLVATRLSPLKNQMLQVEKEMSECRVVIDTYKESMLQDIRDQAQNLRTELAAAEEKLLTVEKVLISEQLAHETAEKELDQAQATETAALDTLKQELRVSQVKVENLTREREQVRDSYLRNVIEVAQNRVTELRQQTVLTDKEIARIQYLRSEGKCSKCGQDTTNLERDGLEALHLEKEISGNELSKAEAVYQEVEKKRQEKLDAVSRELEHAKKLQAERQRNLLDAGESPKVARLKDKVRQAERVVAQRESQRAVCQNSITSIKRSLAEKKSLYLKHKEQIEKGKVRLKDLQEEAASLDKQIHNLEFWKTGFGPKGVPSLFIETVLPRISSCIQRFADILTGGDLAVTLRAYKETKSKTVQEAIQISAVNAKGASVYGANSAGERNRINLAVTLGLVDYFRSMGVFSSNILICDEIFDGLDRTGVEMALQALQEATIPHVLVISHHEHLKPLFPDAMYMVKENGQARLEA
jgi:DNA repair exonuclease SbcCD ATPase subunit